MKSPRTDTIMSALMKMADREQLLSACQLSLAMMEYDLEKMREKADDLKEKFEFNRGVMEALEVVVRKYGL